MWAVIDKDNIVIGCIVEKSYEEASKIAEENQVKLVKMTVENSPAEINGFWDGKKFHEPRRV